MTTVAVLADPPREGLVLPKLVAETPLSEAEATELYVAMLRDVCRAVEASGGDLLVNYRDDADLPEHDGESSEAQLRAAVAPALDSPDDARYEVQVGASFSARAGNTVSHLLEQEQVTSAAVVEPTAPFLTRTIVDNAAMKLRRHAVVLGPASDGRVYYAGFAEGVDFEDAYEPPVLETLTDRGVAADLSVDFLPTTPVVETRSDLVSALAQISARATAERNHPAHTAQCVAELGLDVVAGEDGPELVRE
ncbi:hypothetical protein BV210_14865 [Halorientalis sp. IM1011]|uniref:DUF2064 domain-containing protein n=1 Tax=Halorientalis sp. IM1011 TaxID=1932360 RepID=UPI00097CD466|nr:DUF2064 domain-containing protein [Halorientalis sp. IM1011]AQL43905.1 hypothetical protein BV210_14865 [Halorientalis sp. IM1011]